MLLVVSVRCLGVSSGLGRLELKSDNGQITLWLFVGREDDARRPYGIIIGHDRRTHTASRHQGVVETLEWRVGRQYKESPFLYRSLLRTLFATEWCRYDICTAAHASVGHRLRERMRERQSTRKAWCFLHCVQD